MRILRRLSGNAIFIFSVALAWFAAFIPWNGFRDPDAFYHAKISSLMLQQGPLHRFPWLDLTFFDQSFTDLHFFFHVLLMPFERIFGMYLGSQIAAVVFAALFVTVFFLVLRRARVPLPWFFTLLLSLVPLVIVRLTLAKATPIALIWFVLGMAAVSLSGMRLRQRIALSGIAGMGFALSHGGWSLLILCQFLYVVGEELFERVGVGRPWKQCLTRPSLLVILSAFVGAIVGTVVHPNFPTNIYFLWVQIWKIAVVTPFHRVRLGNEWLPITVEDLVANASMSVIVGLIILYGFLVARRGLADVDRWKPAIAWGFPVAFLVALTLKSIRFAEYFFPAMVWWFALLSTNVDTSAYWQWARVRWNWRTKLLLTMVVGSMMIQGAKTWSGMHKNPYLFDSYQDVFRVLAQQAKPGERIFHTSWDQFPQLFAEDDRYRYVVGLDPTFLLESNPALSDRYHEIMSNRVTTGTYEMIKYDFGSRWIILDPLRQQGLDRVIEKDARFLLQTSSPQAKLYRLNE